MPGTTGMVVNSNKKEHKAIASSVAQTFYQFMGFIPSPILYGLIIELDPRGEESNKGILMI